MQRNPLSLAEREHDLVIVGGGAFGCCAAWEAASRGLSVALVERDDFCHATSANHLKVVHGGIRYLQHLDLARVRESMKERSALLRIAPHLIQPLPIVMPTYGRGIEGRFVLGSGLLLYDLLTLDRNRGIGDPGQRIPRGRLLSRGECLELYPWLDTKRLTGAGLFHDGLFYNPPRLAWAFLRSAIDAGAQAANYVEATGFIRDGQRVRGVTVTDRPSGERFEIRGRFVLNAAGPWAVRLAQDSLRHDFGKEPTFSRDAGIVVRRRLTGDFALACRIGTKDPDAVLSRHGRHVFLVPWRDYTLVGVWHRVHRWSLDDVHVEEAELDEWLRDVNGAYPALGLRREDVSMVYSGLTLFADDNDPEAKNLRFGKRSLLVDHERAHGLEGLMTLVGIRATMARGLAERVVDRVLAKLGVPGAPSRTADTPLWGGKIERVEDLTRSAVQRHGATHDADVLHSLVHNYGTEYEAVLAHAETRPALGEAIGKSKVLPAQVIHAVREELAQKLGDVVLRRTDLGTGGHPGEDALRECAQLMARELGWNEARIREEIREVEAQFP